MVERLRSCAVATMHHVRTRFRAVNEAAQQQQQEVDRDEEPEALDDALLDEGFGDANDECPDKIGVMWDDALQLQTKGSKMLNDAKKARGYVTRPESPTNEQKAERDARITGPRTLSPRRMRARPPMWVSLRNKGI